MIFDPPLTIKELSAIFPHYFDFVFIARGGQGEVYKAQATDGSSVAIKLFFPGQVRKRGELEVQTLQNINCPYLARLVQYGVIMIRGQDSFFTVTSFVEGQNLRQHLSNNGRLEEKEVIKLITNISLAIEQLWDNQVVHCDIKPENILYSSNSTFHLIDLGVAKHLDVSTITQYGMVLGTQGYMAPEQMSSRRNLTIRTDIFALGIIAYESLIGIHPFNHNQTLIVTGKYDPALPSNIINISKEVETVIMEMLNRNCLFRPSSTKEILHKLGV